MSNILESTIITFQAYAWEENLMPDTLISKLNISDKDMDALIFELDIDNGIEFTDEDIKAIKHLATIQDVVNFIENYLVQ